MPKVNDEVFSALNKWRMSRAKLWDYARTLSKTTIRLESNDIAGNLHIVCGGSQHICGPLAWKNSSLSIAQGADAGIVTLKDDLAGFELVCEVISVVEDVDPIYHPQKRDA